jgi:4-hydroxybenzoyl-CoA thioesterase
VGEPFRHTHRVRFEEVDAAGIVYFARFFTWCHDATDDLFGALEGGYVGLVGGRRLGLPAVHVEADYRSPVRFGDVVHLAVSVERLGRSSVHLRFDLTRASGEAVATVKHVVALTDLATMRSAPLPDDVRALLSRYEA